MIHPGMMDGTYEIGDRGLPFYLCGVGQAQTKRAGRDLPLKSTNVHLAVRLRQGSVAAVGSVYGVTFVIKDAESIPIQPLPDGFHNLPLKHSRCKNFQFGYQTFDVTEVGEESPREVVRMVRGV